MLRGVPNIPPPKLGSAPYCKSFLAAKYFSSLIATDKGLNELPSNSLIRVTSI